MCVYVCICMGHVYFTDHLCRSEDKLWELFPYQIDSQDNKQVAIFGGKCKFYQLTSLVNHES